MTRRMRCLGFLPALFLGLGLAGQVAAQDGDADAGAEVFKKCRSCHGVGDVNNPVGPTLNDLFGRKAGTVDKFDYSPANKDAGTKGLVWTEETLFKYLENPVAFMPGTKMVFAGLKDEQDRKDLIAYLKKFSKK
jgi:cytochrome c